MTQTHWQDTDPVEVSIRSVERRRRSKPIVVAIVLAASMVIAFLLAQYYAGTMPLPYGM